jgi:hypothetical protein
LFLTLDMAPIKLVLGLKWAISLKYSLVCLFLARGYFLASHEPTI